MKTLRQAYAVYEPFVNQCYYDNNCTDGYHGFIVDFDKELEKAIGVKVELVEATTFDQGDLEPGSDFALLNERNM